ncbi:FAD-dependent oxidoreductase [Streptomyces cyaneofuscatus]|uniref:FAD-dependent oxidoreductase n=1 Tax=Streptomyces cyaneofuscatus TaxID=66883 RepID=UPI002952DBF6|nr:FAD-dependent oxidoreductase [Streptomyces cyaneofuscatus]WOP07034.1 FAD-dependent oxidoreductase [Streptomyces cyaneofuscatus]
MRIGIAGAGIAGLAAAWLLDGVHDVVVLEARSTLGGNLRTVHLPDAADGAETVELGVQGVPLRLSHLVAAFASALGFRREEWTGLPDSRAIQWESPSILRGGDAADAKRSQKEAARDALAVLAAEAADWIRQDIDWDVSLEAQVNSWKPSDFVRNGMVHALAASLFGCTMREAGQLSARAVGAFYAEPDEDGAAGLFRLRGGMQSLAWRLASDTSTTSLLPGRALRRLHRTEDGWEMIDRSDERWPVDAVVLALPAYAARAALPLSDAPELNAALGAFTYRDLSYGIHRDAFYMPPDRRHWAPSHVTVHGPWAETTSWTRRPGGQDVFVSQLTHRDELPRTLLATSAFRTLQPTTDLVAAQNELNSYQGAKNIYFAGHLTVPVNELESTLASAVAVCRRLTPSLPRLTSLTSHDKELP